MHDQYLYYILEKAGLFGKTQASTGNIAKGLKTSQQTVSRKLRELEEKNLIRRTSTARGVTLSLTEKSVRILKKEYLLLKRRFESKMILKGVLEKGLGQGAYYVNKYQNHLVEKLGYKCFPGTLNLRSDPVKIKEFLNNLKEIEITIPGFRDKSRTFGWIKCYKVTINKKQKGAVLAIERTSHSENVIEIVAPMNLMKKFNIKFGDIVKIAGDM